MRNCNPTRLLPLAAALLALTSACGAPDDDYTYLSEADGIAIAERVGGVAVHDLLRQNGNASPADGFVQRRVMVDEGGEVPSGVHLHVRQTHGGIPVWGGEAIVHLRKDGSVRGTTDNFLTEVNKTGRKTTPDLDGNTAVNRALDATGLARTDLTAAPKSDLWFYRKDGVDRLAWRIQMDRLDGTSRTAKPVVFIDAADGSVLYRYDNLMTGTGKGIYVGTVSIGTTLSGSTYQLKDPTRGNNQTNNMAHKTTGTGTLFTDADDVWGTGANSDAASAAVDAHYGASMTWDYYKNIHGRNGIFNNGTGVPSLVHYGSNYVNAFWDGSKMTYGDGSGNNDPLVELDVAGHEMSHGVTENTANLTYDGESGGLNEATSDIFGTCVEFYANNANDVGDYLIGEMININGDGTPLRYMDKPSRDGASPDCWSSSVGNLDVHYSSGPANHYFYLLAEGSGAKTINGVSYNSPTCNGTSVPGITRAKAEKIWYRALSTYMTSSTNYAAARTATLSAAADLYGANSTEWIVTANTWAAINVGSTVGGTDGGTGGTDGGTGGTDGGGTGGTDGGSTDGGGGGTGGVLTNGVPVTLAATATGSAVNYTLDVTAGATNLLFATSNGTGDADLYVKFGSPPTTTSYDCRPYTSSSAESCSFAAPQTGTYYVMVRAYAAFSGVVLQGVYTPGGGGGSDGGTDGGGGGTDGGTDGGGGSDGGTDGGSNVLSNNVPVTVPSGATGAASNYTMPVPAGATALSFAISGGTGDADLYVKFGSAPTTTSYDCRPYLTGNSETCNITTAQAGTYYVMVRSYAASSGVSLVGKYSTAAPPSGLSNGGFESSISPWVESGTAYYTSSSSTAHGGTGFAYLGTSNSSTGSLYQQITPGTGQTLSFYLYTTTSETTTGTQYDKLFVEVTNTSGTVLGTLATYSNLDKSTTWAQKSVSLSAYAGQTVRIQFRSTTDSTLPTTFRVDDVTLQ
ncbi:MAG: M4 family metallopeptidase [Deltaproteobacteria bacterium]|nr:M4 family metallopeptidase [Deltaproteobacteria bacterium]